MPEASGRREGRAAARFLNLDCRRDARFQQTQPTAEPERVERALEIVPALGEMRPVSQ